MMLNRIAPDWEMDGMRRSTYSESVEDLDNKIKKKRLTKQIKSSKM